MATTYVTAWEYRTARGLAMDELGVQEGEALGVPLEGAPVHAAPASDLSAGLTSLCGQPVMSDTPAAPWPPQGDDELCPVCSEKVKS